MVRRRCIAHCFADGLVTAAGVCINLHVSTALRSRCGQNRMISSDDQGGIQEGEFTKYLGKVGDIFVGSLQEQGNRQYTTCTC